MGNRLRILSTKEEAAGKVKQIKIMEKGRKLSLKRKTMVVDQVESKRTVLAKMSVPDDTSEMKEICSLDSNVADRNTSSATFQDHEDVPIDKGCDSKLLKLREMIYKLSEGDGTSVGLSPFPPHSPHIKQSAGDLVGKQKPSNMNPQQLSPFPKMCQHFISRHSSKHNHEHENINDAFACGKDVPQLTEKSHVLKQSKVELNNSLSSSTGFMANKKEGHEFIEDNASIIRDRNCNLYSMETKNAELAKIAQNRRTKTSETVQVSLTKHSSRKQISTSKVVEIRSNTISSTDKPTRLSKLLENDHVIEHIAGSSTKNVMKQHSIHHRKETVALNKQNENDKANTIQEPNQMAKSGKLMKPMVGPSSERSTIDLESHFSKKLVSQIEGGLTGRSSEDKQWGSVITVPVTPYQQHQVIAVKEQVVLDTCPLCQVKFDKGFGQMEKDSHIAMCLSTAGDDAMW